MDHQDLLGDTLEKIASEKAGIIKESKPVVISETQSSLISVFTKKAQESRSPIFFADSFIRIQRLPFNEGGKLQLKVFQNNEILFENLEPDLVGTYQINNLQGVLASTVILKNLGWQISNEAIKNGIENTIKNTELQGRWQMLQKEPKIIADIAHNEGGIEQLLLQLSFEKYQNLYWIFGMVSDKDVEKILRLIPKECHYIFCQAQIPRALDANLLYEKAKNNGLKGEVIASVKEAYQRAILLATPQDLILVGGSTFVVAEVLT
jgi:dihydrofolate synthase/folylpolyglutamate synthase